MNRKIVKIKIHKVFLKTCVAVRIWLEVLYVLGEQADYLEVGGLEKRRTKENVSRRSNKRTQCTYIY